jgi:hypothetical protein
VVRTVVNRMMLDACDYCTRAQLAVRVYGECARQLRWKVYVSAVTVDIVDFQPVHSEHGGLTMIVQT